MSLKTKTLKIYILFIIFIFALVYFFSNRQSDIIGSAVKMSFVNNAGVKTGLAYVSVPYSMDSLEYNFINIAVDLNKNLQYKAYATDELTQEEWIVRNMPVRIKKKEGNSYTFLLTDLKAADRQNFKAAFIFSKEKIEEFSIDRINKSRFEEKIIGSFSDDDARGRYNPDIEGLRSGGSGAIIKNSSGMKTVAPAAPPEDLSEDYIINKNNDSNSEITEQNFNIFTEYELPDFTQDKNECVIASTSNIVFSLVKKYAYNHTIPREIDALSQQLKIDFKWTENGVKIKDDFLSGIESFTNRHKIPLSFYQIGKKFDKNISGKLAASLKKNHLIQLDLEFGEWDFNGSYKRTGGHMVNLVGMQKIEGITYLEIYDPLSPGKTKIDIYELDGSRIDNYRYQGNGYAFIRYAIGEIIKE